MEHKTFNQSVLILLALVGILAVGFTIMLLPASPPPAGAVPQEDARDGFAYIAVKDVRAALGAARSTLETFAGEIPAEGVAYTVASSMGEGAVFMPAVDRGYGFIFAASAKGTYGKSIAKVLEKGILPRAEVDAALNSGVSITGPVVSDEGIRAYEVIFKTAARRVFVGSSRNLFLVSDTAQGVFVAARSASSTRNRFEPGFRNPLGDDAAAVGFRFYDGGNILADILASEGFRVPRETIYIEGSLVARGKSVLAALDSNLVPEVGTPIVTPGPSSRTGPYPGGGSAYAVFSSHFDAGSFQDFIGAEASVVLEKFFRTVLGMQHGAMDFVGEALGDRVDVVLGGKAWSPLGEMPGLYALFTGGDARRAETLAASMAGLVQAGGRFPVVSGAATGWDYVYVSPIYAPFVMAGGRAPDGTPRVLLGILDPMHINGEAELSEGMKNWFSAGNVRYSAFADVAPLAESFRALVQTLRKTPVVGRPSDFDRAEAMAVILGRIHNVGVRSPGKGKVSIRLDLR